LLQKQKKPRNAFQFFQAEACPRLRKSLGQSSFADITRAVAAEWKQLTPEQKQPYTAQAAAAATAARAQQEQAKKAAAAAAAAVAAAAASDHVDLTDDDTAGKNLGRYQPSPVCR
jgi:hypothetical protein